MLLDCYQKHNSDFEPSDCAKYFEEQGVNVIISSDYTDDQIVIEIKLKDRHEAPFVFRSYKMDKASKNELLAEYQNQAEALRSYNSIAEVSTKNIKDNMIASILLSYLHLRHKAQIIDPTAQKFRGQKALKKLRETNLELYLKSPEKLSLKELIKKYHLLKVAFSIILVIGYVIYHFSVNYNTTLIIFIIIISLIILWSTPSD